MKTCTFLILGAFTCTFAGGPLLLLGMMAALMLVVALYLLTFLPKLPMLAFGAVIGLAFQRFAWNHGLDGTSLTAAILGAGGFALACFAFRRLMDGYIIPALESPRGSKTVDRLIARACSTSS